MSKRPKVPLKNGLKTGTCKRIFTPLAVSYPIVYSTNFSRSTKYHEQSYTKKTAGCKHVLIVTGLYKQC